MREVHGRCQGTRASIRRALAPSSSMCRKGDLSAKVLLISLVSGSTPALAQDVIDEVVVTAQKREQNLQDVPISITALSQDQMDATGVRGIEDVARLTPGLNFDRLGGSDTSISIRGVASNTGASTTGIYIDDTPIQTRNDVGFTPGGAYPKVFDLERIEVLRGPQGTLYGAGSQGGTIRFITKKPNLKETEWYGRTELASTREGDPSYEAGLSVSGPFVEDALGFTLSSWYRHDGGWVDQVKYPSGQPVAEDSNSAENYSVRAAITWLPTEQLSITPSIYFQKIEKDDSDEVWLPSEISGFSQPLGKYERGTRLPDRYEDKFVLATLQADYELSNGNMALAWNSSYYDREKRQDADFTFFEAALWIGTPFPPDENDVAPSFELVTNKSFTHEVRLQSTDDNARVSWVIGAFYSQFETASYTTVSNFWLDGFARDAFGVPIEAILGAPLLQPGDITYIHDLDADDTQVAGFANVDFKPTDHLTFTAGLRYADTKLEYATNLGGPVNNPGGPSAGEQDDQSWTGKIGVSYQTDGGENFYLNVAQGTRIGGVVRPVGSSCDADLAALGFSSEPETYDPDDLLSYEVGAKTSLLGGRATFNASAYYIDWQDIQQAVDLPGCGVDIILNLGTAVIQGFDVEASALLGEHFQVGAGIAYTDAEFSETVQATDVTGTAARYVSDGDAIPVVPFSAYLWGHASFQLASWKSYARFDYSYLAGVDGPTITTNIANAPYSPHAFDNPFSRSLNLRVGVELLAGWDVSLFVNNVMDEDQTLGKRNHAGDSPLYLGYRQQPRTIGVTATYRIR
jgi:iron complex outermembrane recepter protein